MGFDDLLDIEETSDENVAWVRERTDGRGADVVLQAATSNAVPEGLRMLRDGGRYLSVGVGGDAVMPIGRLPGEMAFFAVRSGEPRHWLQALDLLDSRWAADPVREHD